MAKAKTLLAQVLAARKRHGLTFRSMMGWDSMVWVREAERKLGMPAHGERHGSTTANLASAVARAADLDSDDWDQINNEHVLGILDGYLLAEAVMGVAKVRRTFKSGGAFTRFANSAASLGDALVATPVGETVRALVDDLSREFRPTLRTAFSAVMTNAIAAGVLLYATERELKHPTFAGLEVTGAVRLGHSTAPARQADASPELVAAILAAPFDERPRLVYSDWLIEQHDPLGLFIALQCGPRTPQAQAQAQALISKYEKVWVAPIRKLVRQWRFSRGFVNWVVADFEQFFEGQKTLTKVPLLNAKLTAYQPDLLRLADAPPHPCIAAFELSNNRLKPGSIELFARPFFSRARSLGLSGNRLLGERGFELLTEAMPETVTRLELCDTEPTSDCVGALSRWSGFGKLTHLDLRWNRGLDDRTIDFLEGATELRYLGLGMSGMTDAGIEQLASLRFPKLERLAFHGVDVGGLEAFLKSSGLPSLTTLDLPVAVAPETIEALEMRFAPKPWAQQFEFD